MTNSPGQRGEADAEANEETAPPARAIIAGHAGFADGLVSAVEQIAGTGSVFVPLSNSGLTSENIEERFRAAALANHVRVFFTDLPAGSATLAVRRLMRKDPRLILVTGANLATLLEFVFHAEEDPVEAARRAAEKGRASLVSHGGT